MKIKLLVLCLIVLTVPALAQYTAHDPTRYIPSGRVLGLGKAYIGLADDTGAIYTNPAGLADSSGWQLSSMSGKLIDEFSYLSVSGIYPTDFGVFGIGYAGVSIYGAFATTVEAGSDPDDPVYTIDPNQPRMGNENTATVISYASKLDRFAYLKALPQADKLAFGANLKLFKARMYGDGISGGDASGQELDLGVKYTPIKWLSLGAAVQNALPTSMGGKLSYAGNHTESYPAVVECGTAVTVLGRENGLLRFGDNILKIMLDMDYRPTMKGYPALLHVGGEWKPLNILALRAGIDQDASGDGLGGLTTVSDLAYGVGFNFSNFCFDYAYHTFAGAPNIDNHFFSLSYQYTPPVIEVPKEAFNLTPADKLITYESNVVVAGRVVDQRIRTVAINKIPARFSLRGDLTNLEVELKVGKNAILVEGKDEKGINLAGRKLRVLRLLKFPDVPQGYWVAQPVSLLAMQSIITGYPDGSFRPEGEISRAEMCSLLMKTRSTTRESRSTAAFKDVPGKHWAAKFVAQASGLGVVKGYPGNLFKPNGKITRAEGLAMVVRFAGISEEAYSRIFPDIAGTHWAAKIVAGGQMAGLLEYLKDKKFEPNRRLTRAEVVEMLQRTQTVKGILDKDLLNWDSY